jgi:CDP-2,3-bis-(O-geranylgeranyl)-sn-glycerol synthase
LGAIWVFLPVLGGALAHAPVLALDLLKPLKRPLDGGATFRGRRVFGDNKTWRGAIVIVAGVVVATLLLSNWDWWWGRLPGDLRDAGALPYGLLLGLGVVLGEFPNSFLKRHAGIAPGTRRRSATGLVLTIYDQADFVPVVWLLLLPLWAMSPWQAAFVFAVVTAVHLVVNVIGYAIGARTAPI